MADVDVDVDVDAEADVDGVLVVAVVDADGQVSQPLPCLRSPFNSVSLFVSLPPCPLSSCPWLPNLISLLPAKLECASLCLLPSVCRVLIAACCVLHVALLVKRCLSCGAPWLSSLAVGFASWLSALRGQRCQLNAIKGGAGRGRGA